MAFTWNGDPTDDDLHQVRFLCGDTNPNDYLLEDEEINYLLTQESGVYMAASAGFEAMAAKVTREVSFSQEGASAQLSDQYKHYREQARMMRIKAQLQGETGVFVGGQVAVTGETKEPYFAVDMMNNPGTTITNELVES